MVLPPTARIRCLHVSDVDLRASQAHAVDGPGNFTANPWHRIGGMRNPLRGVMGIMLRVRGRKEPQKGLRGRDCQKDRVRNEDETEGKSSFPDSDQGGAHVDDNGENKDKVSQAEGDRAAAEDSGSESRHMKDHGQKDDRHDPTRRFCFRSHIHLILETGSSPGSKQPQSYHSRDSARRNRCLEQRVDEGCNDGALRQDDQRPQQKQADQDGRKPPLIVASQVRPEFKNRRNFFHVTLSLHEWQMPANNKAAMPHSRATKPRPLIPGLSVPFM